ncbi:MAG: enoyl-CoA hydratase-related protein [Burkholderiaceae bacterium]
MSIDVDVLDGGIAVVTINRPDKRNALDAEHYQALSDAWTRVRDDDEIRVAVITGAGDKVFSAGADLKSWIGRKVRMTELWQTQRGMLLNRGLEIWKPVIAAINGHCVGGGMTLMLATDIRVSASHATFGLSEVKRGIIAANGGTQRIPDQLPYAIAMEMLLTGDAIDAQAALRWGLINQVVPSGQELDAALAYARRIAANAPLAVQAAKELALRARQPGLAAGLRFEQFVNHILQRTEDAQEGRTAFAEKRAPKFKGE